MGKGKKKDEASGFVWRVTMTEGDEPLGMEFGSKLSAAPISDGSKIRLVGRALIQTGTQLLGSYVEGEDED